MTGETLRVARTHFPVSALGPGRRFGVWVQGCPLACKGCMSLDTWDPGGGLEVPVDRLAAQWRQALDQGADGLTISGGEPLAQPGPLAVFLEEVHRLRAGTTGEPDILLFTGHTPEELDAHQQLAASYADVLVTGRYEAGRPTRLVWRGSANQQMVLRSELGRRRYAPYLDWEPEQPPLQVRADEHGVWIVGVPRLGTLSRLDGDLRRRGLPAEAVTWRPCPSEHGKRRRSADSHDNGETS
ncbi:4Fe-4S single cluster domain-containing protein [Paractinoplanes brasiliensis]|uniref:Anaerobic ribonucleoside-triphosphate reductase activating protein n=1 Tax=Paractinoplanes brasiliensis TaxID=52695 RepID=A0A4R6K345_9ACTN|nr:4Fe-4S single cluster domain-containing protein [Actinoplanes brasiliensis]TDO42106.1 anaerobic ribonucleoside-triphosphate reductase activating protein [Actinoplanes brasiliensis]GID32031.1 radical activating enzyme [Actinoplanes brasiliensis]